MQLTIDKKDYELKFGLKFIRSLDKAYTQQIEGMEFSMGLQQANIYLNMRNADALSIVIKAALSHLNSHPSNEQLEDYLEEVFTHGKDEDLFKDIQTAMEQAPFLKRQMENLKKEQRKHQKKLTKE